MFAIAFFGLVLAGGLWAQGRPCPDLTIKSVEPVVTPLLPQACGANLNATIGGVRVTTPANVCPLIVVVRPGYDATVSSPGSGTYTIPIKTVPISVLQYECVESWLLGILPIVVSSHCTATASKVAGAVTHYGQLPCDGGAGPRIELDRESARRIISIGERRKS